MYKLIAIDIDGTLLNDKHEITAEVHDAIQQAKKKGVKIVLCSGRAIGGVQRYIKELDLNGEDDFVAAFNGGLVQKASSKEVVMRNTLGLEDLRSLYHLSRELKTTINFFDESKIYAMDKDISRYTVLDAYLLEIDLCYRKLEDLPIDLNISKIIFVDEPEHLEKVIAAIPAAFWEKYAMFKSLPFYFEFLHPQANKGNAVREIAQLLNIKREEIMCIGDSGNDVSMIQYAGCGVAMGNAMDETKKHADYITLTNNESGVAQAIREFVLK